MIVPAGGSEHGASPSELQSVARLPARGAKFRQSQRFKDVNGSGRRGRGIFIFCGLPRQRAADLSQAQQWVHDGWIPSAGHRKCGRGGAGCCHVLGLPRQRAADLSQAQQWVHDGWIPSAGRRKCGRGGVGWRRSTLGRFSRSATNDSERSENDARAGRRSSRPSAGTMRNGRPAMARLPRQVVENAGAARRVGGDRDRGVSRGQPRTIVNARKPARWQGGAEINGLLQVRYSYGRPAMARFPRQVVENAGAARRVGGDRDRGVSRGQPRTILNARKPARWWPRDRFGRVTDITAVRRVELHDPFWNGENRKRQTMGSRSRPVHEWRPLSHYG